DRGGVRPDDVPQLAQQQHGPGREQAEAGPAGQAEIYVGEDANEGGDGQYEGGPAGGPEQAELADAGGQEVEPGVQLLGQLGGGDDGVPGGGVREILTGAKG